MFDKNAHASVILDVSRGFTRNRFTKTYIYIYIIRQTYRFRITFAADANDPAYIIRTPRAKYVRSNAFRVYNRYILYCIVYR